MAHFRATLEGNRGMASRLGTKKSGLVVTVNGWNIGVRVYLSYNEETGKDEASIYKTGGSRGTKNSCVNPIAEFTE